MTAADRPEGVAPAQLNLTAAGWVVVGLCVAAVFIAATSRIAVGFMIPLVGAVLVDLALSWYYVHDRTLSITATRTVAHRPGGIPLRITSTGPNRPIGVTVTFRGGVEQQFSLSDEPVSIELPATHTGVASYVRCAMACSVFGLAIARRWRTHPLPMLHWAPAPADQRLTTPTAFDEVARLRHYVPGDRMSRVSWPITARTGQMHVRAAGDGYDEFVVLVNLGPAEGAPGEGAIDADPASDGKLSMPVLELTATLAATLVSQLLEDGHQVRLVTTELTDEVHEQLRQVALDNPRLPAELPRGTALHAQVVDRFVIDDDDLARRLARAEPSIPMTWPYGSWVDVSMRGVRTMP